MECARWRTKAGIPLSRERQAAASSFIFGVKSDAFAWRIRRGKELADGVEDGIELSAVLFESPFQGGDLAGKFVDGKGHLAQFDDGHAHKGIKGS